VSQAAVRADHNMHTCIEVKRVKGIVKYIPLNINGFELLEIGEAVFDRTYSRALTDYPVDRAAQLYAGYATDLGGTKEAMEVLALFTTLSPKEIEMATAKKAASAAKATKADSKPAEPTAKTKAAKPAAKAVPAKAVKTKEPKAPSGEKKPSAAQMFKDLIMAGKMSDDQIFAQVQKEFNLDENKRSYVKWYRNDLTKKGMKPPAAKA
jgi:hypothetical protein